MKKKLFSVITFVFCVILFDATLAQTDDFNVWTFINNELFSLYHGIDLGVTRESVEKMIEEENEFYYDQNAYPEETETQNGAVTVTYCLKILSGNSWVLDRYGRGLKIVYKNGLVDSICYRETIDNSGFYSFKPRNGDNIIKSLIILQNDWSKERINLVYYPGEKKRGKINGTISVPAACNRVIDVTHEEIAALSWIIGQMNEHLDGLAEEQEKDFIAKLNARLHNTRISLETNLP
ncbi:hypothetical protein A2303_04295 [Candidatus Falkowbacteria bacterium RIFOXYB2_FULL_47_14]|uniref:Uncharacterized protein n=1 Tax=Candidatus Falkowbacteria bacterium RIFOXYA2_FULL_47_19 TaxID=1797994 RepID=A0A1F5SK45_9BACT|nr:MAG: hypothetical protein A2227_04210 [Candidatus Falkowbacteria bacterium RIFOXYA2_FULL_47_19]OGF35390.1 MAG: hypothetical protein A2468_02380 [Candidatus Falkowbacteria bacterium RIFOXYC2_FULL_46_15]OGF43118.1 MAG: hypothetical protein A2303_04295 [Candidatus Falkowbacteria bacterium RIFOXYB2_FULL_47_14]